VFFRVLFQLELVPSHRHSQISSHSTIWWLLAPQQESFYLLNPSSQPPRDGKEVRFPNSIEDTSAGLLEEGHQHPTTSQGPPETATSTNQPSRLSSLQAKEQLKLSLLTRDIHSRRSEHKTVIRSLLRSCKPCFRTWPLVSTQGNGRAVVVGSVTHWKPRLLTSVYSAIPFSVLRTAGSENMVGIACT
jgi:hypothetical protein